MYFLTLLKNSVLFIFVVTVQFTFLTSLNFAQGNEDRIINANKEKKIVNKVPKHLPLKIEILDDDELSRLDEIKIKVTNTGEKPIYYLKFIIVTNENFPKPNGAKIGLGSLKHGNSRLVDFLKTAEEDDIPLKKDESVTFEIKEYEVRSFNNFLAEKGITSEPGFDLTFQFLTFGDATGFWTTGGTPYPSKKQTPKLTTLYTNSFFLTYRHCWA